jgi:hypothetical protein
MKRQKAKAKKTAVRSAKGSKFSSPGRNAKTTRTKGANLKAAGTNPQRVQAILQKLDEA